MNRKSLALGAVFLAGLSAGGVVAADVFGSPAVQAVATAPAIAPAADTAAAGTQDAAAPDADRPTPFADVLAGLVTDGTLTQEQADKVATALEAARPDHGGPGLGRGGHGRGGPRIEAVATALGITPEALRTEIQAGKTIAEIATANGVAVQAVIDVLVADAKDHIAQAVTDGKLTQAEADTKLAAVEQRVTDMVNNPLPARGPGHGGPGHGGPGHGGPGEPTDEVPATTTG